VERGGRGDRERVAELGERGRGVKRGQISCYIFFFLGKISCYFFFFFKFTT
jgi:hypothetical protein